MIEFFLEKLTSDFSPEKTQRLTKAAEKFNQIFKQEDLLKVMEACKHFKALKENFSEEEVGDLYEFFKSIMNFANENPGIILASILSPAVDIGGSVETIG